MNLWKIFIFPNFRTGLSINLPPTAPLTGLPNLGARGPNLNVRGDPIDPEKWRQAVLIANLQRQALQQQQQLKT